MDAKKILTNKSFCPLPWTGFELEPNGNVKNCIISKEQLGNIEQQDIESILLGEKNTALKEQMIRDLKPNNCSGCYLQEKERTKLSSISSRLYYVKELVNKVDQKLYDSKKNFALHHVDLRWTNHCNQACVYCGPNYSSKWAQELGVKIKSNTDARARVKEFVFKNVKQLKNVYLAGGEPLLMNENKEFLKLLLKENPDVNLRVNTNLSSTRTGVFDLLCKFKNVHWIVSAETTGKEYEYTRHHGVWDDFLNNLQQIQQLDHKITFNMLYFILNYKSIFSTIDFFKRLGFHENSFVIGPLYRPTHLNILNLPDDMLDDIKKTLSAEIDSSDFYLKNSYENILKYITSTPWDKDINSFKKKILLLDSRRNQSAEDVFPELFKELNRV
jgi:radical SAM protein with 4Fe4S-binding SPASM domain